MQNTFIDIVIRNKAAADVRDETAVKCVQNCATVSPTKT